MSVQATSYPVTYDVEYPERLSRWLIFVKWLLAIPHFIILYALIIVAEVLTFIAWFAILFTGRYPQGHVRFRRRHLPLAAERQRLRASDARRVPAVFADGRPVPGDFRRRVSGEAFALLIFVKWLLIIPHLIVLAFVGIVYYVTLIIAWFAILFTAHYPEGLFKFAVGFLRWGARVNAYFWLMRDEYPPFSLS